VTDRSFALWGVLLCAAFSSCPSSARDLQTWAVPSTEELLKVVAPPPAPNSPDQKQDLAAARAIQTGASPDELIRAEILAVSQDVFSFSAVLGVTFVAPDFPETAAFFKRLERSTAESKNLLKDHFARPRPYLAHPEEIKPLVTPDKGFSYPSGHSMRAWLMALVLSELAPASAEPLKRFALLAAHCRVVGGMHYPSDTVASRVLAQALFEFLQKDSSFVADLERLRESEWTPPPSPAVKAKTESAAWER